MIESTSSNRRLATSLSYGECPYCGRTFNADHRCIKELYKNNDKDQEIDSIMDEAKKLYDYTKT